MWADPLVLRVVLSRTSKIYRVIGPRPHSWVSSLRGDPIRVRSGPMGRDGRGSALILLSAHHSRYETSKLDGMYVVSCGRSQSNISGQTMFSMTP